MMPQTNRPKPLTQRELDQMRCGNPGCIDPGCSIFVSARCHPASQFTVEYVKQQGVLRIACGSCGRPVVDVKVASHSENPAPLSMAKA